MINHGLFGNRDVKPAEDNGLMASIMRAIKGNPEIKRALDDEERIATQAERRPSIIAELKKIRDDAQKRIGTLAAAEASALAELEAIEPRYEATAANWKRAKQALDFERHAAVADETRLLDELEANADPIIDQALDAIRREWAEFTSFNGAGRTPPRSELKSRVVKGDRVVSTYLTNGPSIEKRRLALLEAMRETLPALKRDPDQSNIAERCAAIIQNLPDADEMVVVQI